MLVRDPLPNEEAMYRGAVRSRNEEMYRSLFDLYPNVLWGSVTNTLSPEDKLWMDQVCEKIQRERLADSEDYWD